MPFSTEDAEKHTDGQATLYVPPYQRYRDLDRAELLEISLWNMRRSAATSVHVDQPFVLVEGSMKSFDASIKIFVRVI